MKKISLLTWLGGALLSLAFIASSCGVSKQALTPQMVDGSYAAKEKALMWRISGKKLKKSSYLFGTIHMIDKKDFFLPEYVKTAFDESENVVFEINTDDMTDMSAMGNMMDMMFMDDGTTLKDLLSEEDYKRVKKSLNENPLMMMMGDMVDKIKPLFLSAMIDQGDMGGGSGDNPLGGGGGMMGMGGNTMSYEMEFTKMAKAAEKPIAGLETVDFQMSMFDSISLEDQANMLVQSLDAEKDEGEDALSQMVALYKAQDIPGLHQMIHEQSAGSVDFEDKLLNMRNKNWIPLMAEQMPENVTFFAVGAGHLGGEEGVIALLRKEGYVVVPVLK
jgi:uncharacterized protein YbaP (TraB family)